MSKVLNKIRFKGCHGHMTKYNHGKYGLFKIGEIREVTDNVFDALIEKLGSDAWEVVNLTPKAKKEADKKKKEQDAEKKRKGEEAKAKKEQGAKDAEEAEQQRQAEEENDDDDDDDDDDDGNETAADKASNALTGRGKGDQDK